MIIKVVHLHDVSSETCYGILRVQVVKWGSSCIIKSYAAINTYLSKTVIPSSNVFFIIDEAGVTDIADGDTVIGVPGQSRNKSTTVTLSETPGGT